MLIFRKFTKFRKFNRLCSAGPLLYAVVLLKVWGCCEKFSKFCHGELASLDNNVESLKHFGKNCIASSPKKSKEEMFQNQQNYLVIF